MKVLVLDHHFGQDIDALVHSGHGKYEFRRVLPLYFAERARKHLPEAIFEGDLYEYHKPMYEDARRKWAREARSVLFELYQIYPFDIMISPSDIFFYIRDVVKAASELGVPFAVVQKETTISPDGMEFWAKETGRLFPFISDYMTVCSQRHKEFWVTGGAPADKIEVTGQPRFDFYRQPQRWLTWEQLGIPLDSGRQTILFFTYELDAYLPHDYSDGRLSWARLREETEDVLVTLARSGDYNLLIKPHPQQDPRDVEHIRAQLKALSNGVWQKSVFLVEREFDIRQLIVNANIVVGFQTTALFEALIMGKDVIYTYWTSEVDPCKDALIPYHEYSDIMNCARSPQELTDYILHSPKKAISDEVMRQRLELFEKYLGPIDGRAAERVLRIIDRVVNGYPDLTKEQRHLRESLASGSRRYCRREIRVARFKLLFWYAMALSCYSLKLGTRFAHYWPKIWVRIWRQHARIAECKAALGQAPWSTDILTGRIDDSPLLPAKSLLRRLLHMNVQPANS